MFEYEPQFHDGLCMAMSDASDLYVPTSSKPRSRAQRNIAVIKVSGKKRKSLETLMEAAGEKRKALDKANNALSIDKANNAKQERRQDAEDRKRPTFDLPAKDDARSSTDAKRQEAEDRKKTNDVSKSKTDAKQQETDQRKPTNDVGNSSAHATPQGAEPRKPTNDVAVSSPGTQEQGAQRRSAEATTGRQAESGQMSAEPLTNAGSRSPRIVALGSSPIEPGDHSCLAVEPGAASAAQRNASTSNDTVNRSTDHGPDKQLRVL